MAEIRELMELYENNQDFREYVDKCRRNYSEGTSATLNHVLGCAVTRKVAAMYREYGQNRREAARSTHTPMGECV